MERTYAEYAARQAMELLAIDSPTGFTARAADWVQRNTALTFRFIIFSKSAGS